MKKSKWVIEPPKFSWDKPIELEILDYCRRMASQMERISNSHDTESIREGAVNYADAYRTVERHIIKEIDLRKNINAKLE